MKRRALRTFFLSVVACESGGCFLSRLIGDLEGVHINVFGQVPAPSFQVEGEVSCSSPDIRVDQLEPEGPRLVWDIARSGDCITISEFEYGRGPHGFETLTEPEPLVPGSVYSVSLRCGRFRANGGFRLAQVDAGVEIENVDLRDPANLPTASGPR